MKIKKIILGVLLLSVICMLPTYNEIIRTSVKMVNSKSNNKMESSAEAIPIVLVLDAGHGGFDGGASSINGIYEKNINLLIAKRIQSIAENYNIEVIMTRMTDTALIGKTNKTIKEKKREDLINRRKVIDESNGDLVISIHLNSFSQDSRVRGAQVFYPSKNCSPLTYEVSKNFSELLQNKLEKNIDDGKERTAMEKNDIFLFQNVTKPTILVECGFLSNPIDLKNLQNTCYQNRLAITIIETIIDYYKL